MKYLLFVFALSLFSCQSIVGEKVPDFKETTSTQTSLTLEDLKGKVTVINVWATWCGSCITEIPALNSIAEKYKDNPEVKLIAVSDEDQKVVEAFLKKRPFNWEHVYGSKEITAMLQTKMVRTYPQTLVIDKDLRIVFEQSGGTQGIESTLDALISGMLN